MSWISTLSETYDVCIKNKEYADDPVPLLPLFHTTNQAQIEVTIDIDGNFLDSQIVDKRYQTTLMPCTEESSSRTSGLAPYPLDDKLQYLIPNIEGVSWKGDNDDKGKIPKSGYSLFLAQLKEWIDSDYGCEKILAIYKYVQKGTLLNDLVNTGSLYTDEEGVLLGRKTILDRPLVSRGKITGEQCDVFIRWRVSISDDKDKDTWSDEEIQSKWIEYCLSKTSEKGLSYVSGLYEPLANIHPAKIRHAGDKAKLISSDNKNSFTYMGRFDDPRQAYGVGLQTTQKAHNALRWLIGRQGYKSGDLNIVTWAISGEEAPDVFDPNSILYSVYGTSEDDLESIESSIRFNNRLKGYNSKLINDKLMIMAIDSATTGRMSILYFREYLGKDLLDRLDTWFNSLTWKHNYKFNEKDNGKKERCTFIGAPCPEDIVKAAYGENADGKLIGDTIKRILPCILDGAPIPRDIVDASIRRASNPNSHSKPYFWNKTLTISCSLYKKLSGVDYNMSLEKERTTRDYLYGRLLAIANLLESAALKKAGESRQTTAERLMQRFSEYPYATWRDIELALQPYRSRLDPGLRAYYDGKIAEVMTLFKVNDFKNNSRLSGEFLIGYHCQIEDQYTKKSNDEQEE